MFEPPVSMKLTVHRPRLLGPKQVSDAYLLGLAYRQGGRLVSFDRALPWRAVRGASHRLIESIG
jgi:hypothetical protein